MNELEKNREYSVVKANELIQKSRFELSLVEQKTIAYICSKIVKAPDTELLEYEFDIREYCKVCGIDYDNGANYANVKATLKSLRDRSMWLEMEDGSEVLVGWLAKAKTNKKSGIVNIKIDEDLAPYLFHLGERFTQYQLMNILEMKSAFSVRIYEILKSYEYLNNHKNEYKNNKFRKDKFGNVKVRFGIDELKKMLMVENVKSYNRYPDFRRKVLEIAQREINGHTDIEFKFTTETKGRKVIAIEFEIKSLTNPIDRLIISTAKNERLNKKIGVS